MSWGPHLLEVEKAGFVGVAGLAAATYFWVAGDDPHRYEGLKDNTDQPAKSASLSTSFSFGAGPLEGSGQVGLAGSF